MKFKSSFVSKGLGSGNVIKYKRFIPKINENLNTTIEEAIKDLNEAINKSVADLNKLYKMIDNSYHDEADIILSHIEIINDLIVKKEIIDVIKTNKSASYAVNHIYLKYINSLNKSDDEYLKERSEDLNDVLIRLLKHLEGYQDYDFTNLTKDHIVVAYDLLPSEIANFDLNYVKGFITELGGPTSHSIIMARSFNIPAVVGIKDVMSKFDSDDFVLLNSEENTIITNPNQDELHTFNQLKVNFKERKTNALKYELLPAITKDNQRIEVLLNLNDLILDDNLTNVADGVGLYRSEFLFMNRKKSPSVDEQVKAYQKILMTFKDKPVTIRTLDIGGDKIVDYIKLEKEENPILGIRGIRLSFEYLDIFKDQLKALLIANYNLGNLQVMFPMVTSVDDIKQIKVIVNEVESELLVNKINYQSFKFGIMIEVPSLIFILDKVIPLIDFASVGTNDLTQYMLAIDRQNPLVKNYDQIYSPSAINAIYQIIKTFNKFQKQLTVCGELAGDSSTTKLFLGAGLTSFSMSRSQVASVKNVICNSSIVDSKKLLQEVLELDSHNEINEFLLKNNLN